MKKNWRRKAPLVVLIAIGGIFAYSAVVMLLWNAVMAPVLHAGVVTLWQAMGLVALSKLLFSGFRGRRHPGHFFAKRMCGKWNKLTPEDREKFRARTQHRMNDWQMPDNPSPSA